MHCLSLTQRHGAADYANHRCAERWSSLFCEGKNQFVLVGVAESVTLGWWGLSLASCPEPTHTHTHKHACSASRDKEHRAKKRGDEEGHEQAVRGGNREKTDAAEGKKWKTKLNGEHLVFLSGFFFCNCSTAQSSPKVGVFSYWFYFYF